MTAPTWIDAAELRRRMPPARAAEVLRDTLRAGYDPAGDHARTAMATPHGEMLLMPSHLPGVAGIKLIGIAPDNSDRGLPRIHGWYVLFDGETLAPRVLLDGQELTQVRTAAVSAVGLEVLAPDVVDTAVIVGSGPQALGHAEALLALRDVGRFVVVGRDPARAATCAERIEALDGSHSATYTTDPTEVEAAVRAAQVVMCCTTAGEPVIAGEWVADGACVVAVGSHSPARRELDSQLVAARSSSSRTSARPCGRRGMSCSPSRTGCSPATTCARWPTSRAAASSDPPIGRASSRASGCRGRTSRFARRRPRRPVSAERRRLNAGAQRTAQETTRLTERRPSVAAATMPELPAPDPVSAPSSASICSTNCRLVDCHASSVWPLRQ